MFVPGGYYSRLLPVKKFHWINSNKEIAEEKFQRMTSSEENPEEKEEITEEGKRRW